MNVLNFFILTKWKLDQQCDVYPDMITLYTYTGQRRYIMLLYYLEFLELGTGTCEASASSMWREGDWDHIRYMILTFLVELHFDDVLEVLLVVGSKIYQNDI